MEFKMFSLSKLLKITAFTSLFALTACTGMSQSATQIQQSGGHLKTIVPIDVAFVGKSTHLSPRMTQILMQETRVLHAHPDLHIKVLAYTDNQSNPKTAQLLSLRRAMVVADYFRMHGISSSRISTVGGGAANPIADNTTKDGRVQNRRIELVFM